MFGAIEAVPTVVDPGVHGFTNHHDVLVFADRSGSFEPFDHRVVHGFQRDVGNLISADDGHHGDVQCLGHCTGGFHLFDELGVVAVFGLGVADCPLPTPAPKAGELGDFHPGFVAGDA